MSLRLAPVSLRVARQYVADLHRHHKPPQGGKFAISVIDENDDIRGVVIVGRPVARGRDDGFTAEVTRLCTDGTKNACSMLYAAAWRAARAMGYLRIGTYILESETGTSLKAAGWRCISEVRGRSWSSPSRPRTDKHPLDNKTLWEMTN